MICKMQKIRQGYPVAVTIPICSEILSSEARKNQDIKALLVDFMENRKSNTILMTCLTLKNRISRSES